MARIAGGAPQPGRVTRSQSRELDDPAHDRSTRWNPAPGKGTGSTDREYHALTIHICLYVPPITPPGPRFAILLVYYTPLPIWFFTLPSS